MADYKQIDKARKTLKLGESATIPEIKEAYRTLSLKYHPDKCKEKDNKKFKEKLKQINNANEFLIEYCLNYKFPFEKAEDVKTLEEKQMKDYMKRFYNGWWGDLNNE